MYGITHGNCKTSDRGARWCYVDRRYSTCHDLKPSTRSPGQYWTYEGCATPALNSYQCRYNNGYGNNNNGYGNGYGYGNNYGNGYGNNYGNGYNNGYNNGYGSGGNGYGNNVIGNNGYNLGQLLAGVRSDASSNHKSSADSVKF